ncbi:MAG TPA: HAMP domain-containing sensor histidine kinase, partial [Spirochaetia bacterium]
LDPLLQSWMQRARATVTVRPDPLAPVPPQAMEARLEVYSAHGSLATTIRQQEALNLGISLGILVLLLASAFTLSRLYLRSAALRASEQGFVASMSHELRTPISVIQATSENLSRGVVSDPARVTRYAGVIYGQIKRLAGMVEGILIYSGLQSGKPWAPSISDVYLGELIAEITQPLHYLASTVGATLVVRTEGMPTVIRSDRMSLSMIVENLVMNAIRHADPAEIRLSLDESGGSLRIVVEDGGPGIPTREQRRVFDPFVRGERSVKDQEPGSGLGLHLVRRVTQLLEGSVTLSCPYTRSDGTVVRGCRFVVLLPLKEVERGA